MRLHRRESESVFLSGCLLTVLLCNAFWGSWTAAEAQGPPSARKELNASVSSGDDVTGRVTWLINQLVMLLY